MEKKQRDILLRKFNQYLIPSIITTLAMSLSEFADSLIVSNLLGNNAMAIVNMGAPIAFVMGAVYYSIGVGGSVLYANALGKREEQNANKIYTLSILFALFCGLLLMVLGLVFGNAITSVLCKTPELTGQARGYVRMLMFSMPFLITIITLTNFLPAAGSPNLATAVNIIANVLNCVLDVVFIKFFGFGVEGAALATAVSFCLSSLLMVGVILMHKVHLKFALVSFKDISMLLNVCKTGSYNAISQLGFAIKFTYCNAAAATFGGAAGVVAMALCIQTLSIVNVFMTGVTQTIIPLLSMLQGQEDYRQIPRLFKRAAIFLAICMAVCTGIFAIFPGIVTTLYSVTDPSTVVIGKIGIRIFALCFIFRGLAILFMGYVNVIGQGVYASFISLFDGPLGVIPIGMLLTSIFGLNGIWMTYPVDAILLVILILVANFFIAKKSKGKYSFPFLLQHETRNILIYEKSFVDDAQSVGTASKEVQQYCYMAGLSEHGSMVIGLAVEEMMVYVRNHAKDSETVDILLRITDGDVTIDYRSIGAPFDPLTVTDTDSSENVTLLNGIAKSIEYVYIMGMNSTKIHLSRE